MDISLSNITDLDQLQVKFSELSKSQKKLYKMEMMRQNMESLNSKLKKDFNSKFQMSIQ